MKVNVEAKITYEVRPILGEAGNWSSQPVVMDVRENVEVHIPELTFTGPVAAIFMDADVQKPNAYYSKEHPASKAVFKRTRVDPVIESSDILQEFIKSEIYYSSDIADLYKIKRTTRPPASRTIYSNKHVVESTLAGKVYDKNICIVNGALLKSADEPSIFISVDKIGNLYIDSSAYPCTQNYTTIAAYRLDEWERLQDDVACVAAPSVSWGGISRVEADPEFCSADLAEQTRILAVKQLLRDVGVGIDEFPIDLLDDFCDLDFHSNPAKSYEDPSVRESISLGIDEVYERAERIAGVLDTPMARACLAMIDLANDRTRFANPDLYKPIQVPAL